VRGRKRATAQNITNEQIKDFRAYVVATEGDSASDMRYACNRAMTPLPTPTSAKRADLCRIIASARRVVAAGYNAMHEIRATPLATDEGKC